MPEMHLKQPGFTYSAFDRFTKNKERLTNFCRLEIQILFTKMILIKLVFNMIWLMVNQKIYQEETNQIKFWEIKCSKFHVAQNIMDI